MSKIAVAIEQYWGIRCPDFDETCSTCQAWAEYDELLMDQELLEQTTGYI